MARTFLTPIVLGGEQQNVADSVVLTMGYAGTLPSATTNDTADFNVVVPYNMTLEKLKASTKTAPSSSTTMQIRRSTNSGSSFSDAFGTVQIASSAKVGTNDPANLDVNEGDVLQFSITVGGGSGTNLLVMVIGRRKL